MRTTTERDPTLATAGREGYSGKCERPGLAPRPSRNSFRVVFPARPRHGDRPGFRGAQTALCPHIIAGRPAEGNLPAAPIVLRAGGGL
jgi:hypothetical protein